MKSVKIQQHRDSFGITILDEKGVVIEWYTFEAGASVKGLLEVFKEIGVPAVYSKGE